MPSLFLIDASPYIFRAYYALPDTIQTPDGVPANAIRGYTDFLLQILASRKHDHIVAAFDGSLTTSFRNEIYPDYKAQRELPPIELEQQIANCQAVTEAFGIKTIVDGRYEADDLIGTIASHCKYNFETVIVSSDKDFVQLLDDGVLLWDFARKKKYDPAAAKEKFGVHASQFVDYLSLVGDAVDNIPGVPGVGSKIAACLLENYKNLDDIYCRLDTVSVLNIRGAKKLREKLLAGKEKAYLSKRLAEIVTDLPLDFGSLLSGYEGADYSMINKLFARFGFGAIKERVREGSYIA